MKCGVRQKKESFELPSLLPRHDLPYHFAHKQDRLRKGTLQRKLGAAEQSYEGGCQSVSGGDLCFIFNRAILGRRGEAGWQTQLLKNEARRHVK